MCIRDSTGTPASVPSPTAGDEKQAAVEADMETAQSTSPPVWKRKSYLDKLKIWQSSDINKPNHLVGMVSRPLIFLTFPVIAYAGFSYGSNLVWFNVLNGTASLILGGKPYDFPAWAVGQAWPNAPPSSSLSNMAKR